MLKPKVSAGIVSAHHGYPRIVAPLSINGILIRLVKIVRKDDLYKIQIGEDFLEMGIDCIWNFLFRK